MENNPFKKEIKRRELESVDELLALGMLVDKGIAAAGRSHLFSIALTGEEVCISEFLLNSDEMSKKLPTASEEAAKYIREIVSLEKSLRVHRARLRVARQNLGNGDIDNIEAKVTLLLSDAKAISQGMDTTK